VTDKMGFELWVMDIFMVDATKYNGRNKGALIRLNSPSNEVASAASLKNKLLEA
jgi:hypothetical protein